MIAAILLALSLAASPGDAGPPPAPEVPVAREAPAGAPADQRLWRELSELTGFAAFHMARIGQCAYRIRYDRYYEGLDARRATDPAAAALRARLEQAALDAERALPADGGRLRACRYALLDLEQRMDLLDDPRVAAELPRFRDAAGDCVARLSALVASLRPRADALEAVLVEVDAFLGRAVKVPAGGAAAPEGRP